MFCPKCGKETGENQAFCSSCGAATAKEGVKSSGTPVPTHILDQLPATARTELPRMSAEKQSVFVEEFNRKKKSVALAYVLWFLFGFHYIYFGKVGLQFFYWITCGGFFIWAFIDLFRIPGIVSGYNKDKSVEILRDMKIVSL